MKEIDAGWTLPGPEDARDKNFEMPEQAPIEFADLDLSKLKYSEINNERSSENFSTKIGRQAVDHLDDESGERHHLTLVATEQRKTIVQSDGVKKEAREYHFRFLEDTKEVLMMTFRLYEANGKNVARDYIVKEKGFLPGSNFAVKCYEKMLDFMESISKAEALEFTHEVIHVSSLSLLDWDKKVKQIFQSRKYTPTHFSKVVGGEEAADE